MFYGYDYKLKTRYGEGYEKEWMVMKKMSVFEFSFSGLCTVKYSDSSQD